MTSASHTRAKRMAAASRSASTRHSNSMSLKHTKGPWHLCVSERTSKAQTSFAARGSLRKASYGVTSSESICLTSTTAQYAQNSHRSQPFPNSSSTTKNSTHHDVASAHSLREPKKSFGAICKPSTAWTIPRPSWPPDPLSQTSDALGPTAPSHSRKKAICAHTL